MEFNMRSIGIIHTPFTDPAQVPIQSSRSKAAGQVELLPEYGGGLQGLEGFSHIFLLYVWHQASSFNLLVTPFLDDRSHGIFATRYPARPNQIGISVVRLLRMDGLRLSFEGADMLDGTPLLDIKPYVSEFDLRTGTRSGWYETRARE